MILKVINLVPADSRNQFQHLLKKLQTSFFERKILTANC